MGIVSLPLRSAVQGGVCSSGAPNVRTAEPILLFISAPHGPLKAGLRVGAAVPAAISVSVETNNRRSESGFHILLKRLLLELDLAAFLP